MLLGLFSHVLEVIGFIYISYKCDIIYLFHIKLVTIQFHETESEITYLPNLKADFTFKILTVKYSKIFVGANLKKANILVY